MKPWFFIITAALLVGGEALADVCCPILAEGGTLAWQSATIDGQDTTHAPELETLRGDWNDHIVLRIDGRELWFGREEQP